MAKKAAKRKKKSPKKAKKAPRKKPAKRAAKAPKPKVAKKASKGKASRKRAKRKARVKSPLTKAQIREFGELLLAKRRDLVGDMAGIQDDAINSSRHDNGGGNMPTHPADIGSDNYEQEFSLGLLESERVLLEEIDQALQRVEEGTYGVCLGTGEPIGLPRLRARPWAKYSIEYQRMIEKGLVQPETHEDEEEEEAVEAEAQNKPEDED